LGLAATIELPTYRRDRNAVPVKVLPYRPEGGAWAVADIDGDGRTDLVYFGAAWDVPNQVNPPTPILVYHNLGKGKFDLVAADQLIEGSFPNVQLARRIISADFNSDGRLDVVVASSGHDFFPFPGEKNLLFLSRPNGKLAVSTAGFPQFNDFTHGIAAGDIDGDGDNDIFVANLCCGDQVGSYFLINDGQGNFSFNQTRLPADFWGGKAGGANANTILSPRFVDADLDGHLDLVLGLIQQDFMQITAPGVLLLNNGSGDYSNAQRVEFPVGLFGDDNTMTLDILSFDVNDDGFPDLFLSQTDIDHAGARVQTLINNGDGSFRDESFRLSTSFPYVPKMPALWIERLEAIDFNNDGHLDVVVQLMDNTVISPVFVPAVRTTIFVNDGNGFFQQIPAGTIPNTPSFGFGTLNFVSLFPISDNSGELHFVGSEFQCTQLDHTGSTCLQSTALTSVYLPGRSNVSNISTRGSVLTGDNVMIGGFIIQGSSPKTVLIRSRGPSMAGAPFNLPGTLANPSMQLFSGSTVIAQNDNWQDAPSCSGFTCGGAIEIAATGLDPCQPNPEQSGPPSNCALESAILITLPPGAYTAIVRGVSGGTGVGLMEVFEADAGTSSRLVNISTRGLVQTGDNVMIGGLIVQGSVPKTVLIRARGPSMGAAPFNIGGTLSNPLLRLFSGSTLIAQNDNWQDAPSCGGFACGGAATITSTGLDPCQPNPGQSTSPPGCNQESAILITLPPGAYTAIVSGADGGTGVGIVEVFEAD
jgi:hypothetical protein